MDHQYEENGARNMQLNHNQMRAHVNPLQINLKNYTLSTFPTNTQRNFEDSEKVLAIPASEVYQSITVQLYQPTFISWHAFVSHLANIFRGRIQYELIYSLRGAKH